MPTLHIQCHDSHVKIFIEDLFFLNEGVVEKGVAPSKINLSHHFDNNN
jgi:hypothetical protein